jgi:hypothetical protein
MLLYGNDTFLQVLEGEEAVLDTVVDKIEKDPRHSKIHFLYRKPLENRQYSDWSMGFKRVSAQGLQRPSAACPSSVRRTSTSIT